ncbi:hypothetical protein PG996_009945 [Apiospora saccharicola]|uniref:EthD domain-containing protein n=1 Tax=Apiospora saccharicola TaxID=335842 RepID=A0ABR1UM66_9PEZI
MLLYLFLPLLSSSSILVTAAAGMGEAKVTMLIAYPTTLVFNSTYYLANHVPAVAAAWKPYGLTGYRALQSQYSPTEGAAGDPYAMIFEAEWPGMDAVNDMLTKTPAEEKQRFEEDEKRFTDRAPAVWFMGVGAQG